MSRPHPLDQLPKPRVCSPHCPYGTTLPVCPGPRWVQAPHPVSSCPASQWLEDPSRRCAKAPHRCGPRPHRLWFQGTSSCGSSPHPSVVVQTPTPTVSRPNPDGYRPHYFVWTRTRLTVGSRLRPSSRSRPCIRGVQVPAPVASGLPPGWVQAPPHSASRPSPCSVQSLPPLGPNPAHGRSWPLTPVVSGPTHLGGPGPTPRGGYRPNPAFGCRPQHVVVYRAHTRWVPPPHISVDSPQNRLCTGPYRLCIQALLTGR